MEEILKFDYLKDKYNMKINGVLHIGAHYGQEMEIYERNNISKVIFVEPLENNFKILKERHGDKSTLIKKALGNETKKIKMFVETANNGMSSSILKPLLHTQQYPHIKFNKEEVVEMVKLDDILENDGTYNFINIDVQGYELEVFKGGKKFLENVDYLISEVNRQEVYENCTKVNDLDEFLHEYGFYRVETNWVGGSWGDALYVKR